MDEEPQVSYSIKEILGDINRKLDSALSALAGKADVSEVEALKTRMSAVESHIEFTKVSQANRSHFREWVIPVLVAAVLAIFTILQVMHI